MILYWYQFNEQPADIIIKVAIRYEPLYRW